MADGIVVEEPEKKAPLPLGRINESSLSLSFKP
jgi:hypothetical protein